VVAGTNYLFVL